MFERGITINRIIGSSRAFLISQMAPNWIKKTFKFCRPMISCKAMTKILYGNSENAKKKMASRNIFWNLFCTHFFMFVLLISNHTVFLLQVGINLHL